ncbi:hypothetical protein V8C37DRAFT_70244 [Trichoderma ceciliae]
MATSYYGHRILNHAELSGIHSSSPSGLLVKGPVVIFGMRRTCNVTSIPLYNDDEWRGTTNPSVRRRVQNRLNQRAYRLRRRRKLGAPDEEAERAADKTIPTTTTGTLSTPAARLLDRTNPEIPVLDAVSGEGHSGAESHFTYARSQVCRRDLKGKHGVAPGTRTDLAPWYTNPAAVFVQFQELKLGRHVRRSPSNDHLLCIMQFNVMRAFGTISSIIGLSPANLTDDHSSSPFFNYHLSADSISPTCLPRSLAPTALQKSTPHHPWLDILPFPQMRDNLLRLESNTTTTTTTSTTMDKPRYDADSLCHWMVGLDADQKEAGLILWGDPWNLAAWEVTADFFRKWGWTLEGCVELFRSTNYWRVRRGEKPLFVAEKV